MSSIDQDLEKSLKDGIAQISSDVIDKYGNLKVSLNVPATTRLIFDRLENLEEEAESKQPQMMKLIEETERENPDKLAELKDRALCCQKLIDFIQMMKLVEKQLIVMRSKSGSLLDWGKAIIDCKDHLSDSNSIMEAVKCEGFDMSEAMKNFASEYSLLNFQCRYFLSAEYENYIKIPKISKQKRDRSNISITLVKACNIVDQRRLNEALSAMNMIGQLKERIDVWKVVILDIFCDAIIASRDGESVYHIEAPAPNQVRFVLLPKAKNRKDQGLNVEKVLSAMEQFFEKLAGVLEGLELLDATQKTFVSLLGNNIQERLIEIVLKDVIAIAAPVSVNGDEDRELFCQLIARGEKFVEKLKALNFLPPSSKLLFKLNTESIFVTRRCFAIVTNANKLISESYVRTCVVGVSEERERDENSLKEFIENARRLPNDDKEFLERLQTRSSDSSFPPLFSLQKCTVSQSVVSFVKLLRDTMKGAFEATDEVVREKLAVTAQNIVRLYVIQSPRKHADVFSSVPGIAAIFYNNCYYISHCIMTMSFESAMNKASKMMLESLLVDSVSRLREVAAVCLEKTLVRVKRDLSVYLENHKSFEMLPTNYDARNSFSQSSSHDPEVPKNDPELVKSLNACLVSIRSISDSFREILTEIVFCKSIGSLVSFVLNSIIRHVISAHDIRENDANVMAEIFRCFMKACEDILMYNGKSYLIDYCSKEYFRLNEIVFVLKNRMQDIEMRWFSGKGPMAEHLSHKEVVGLVQALFADSKHRSDCINRL